jgi:hypothetical protein
MAPLLGMLGGSIVSGLAQGLFGPKKPSVPPFTPTDIGTVQSKAIAANLANLSGAEKLGGAINIWTQDQLRRITEGIVGPGTMGQIQSNIADLVAGKLPESALQRAQLRGAAKSLGMGVAGSEFGAGMALAGIREDQLKNMETGFSQALQWLNATRAPMFDLSAMQISPSQAYEIAAKENAMAWNREWLSSEMQAMPSSWQAAGAQMFGGIGGALQTAGMFGMLGNALNPGSGSTSPSSGSGSGGLGMQQMGVYAEMGLSPSPFGQ